MKIPLLIVALFLAGCSGLAPAVSDLRTVAVVAEQPVVVPATPTAPATTAPSPLAKPAAQAVAAIDKYQPYVDAINNLTTAVAAQTPILDKAVSVAIAGQQTIHTVAPNTPADNYATAAVGVIGLLAALGKILDHRATTAAINAPGTTLPQTPEAKS